MLKVNIIGEDGNFGSFLKSELYEYCKFDKEASIHILCIPYDSYFQTIDELKEKNPDNFIVNVCSVQEEINKYLHQKDMRFIGIHPLFGRRSLKDSRVSWITDQNYDYLNRTEKVIKLFSKISKIEVVMASTHDEVMALTHGAVVKIQKDIQNAVKKANWILNGYRELIPPSFKKLIELSETFGDMPEGTLNSIKANKYLKDE